MWRSNGIAQNSASDSARQFQKHTECLKKNLVIMRKAKLKPTNGLNVSSTDGCQSMMQSVLNDLRPEPDRKCSKSVIFKTSFIGNFFHQDRRWMENSVTNFWGDWGKNIQLKRPNKWGINSSALNRDNAPAHASLLCSSFWLLRIRQSSPTLPTYRTSPLWLFPIPEDEIEAQRATFWQR